MTNTSRTLRRAGAVALSLALAMSTLAVTPAAAAKKVKLAKSKITVNVKKTKTVKIKNIKKKQVKKLTVKSKNKSIATAKAKGKTAIKVTGKKAGSTKVIANLKLKKKVGGKKAYKLTLKVTVKKAGTTPTATPVVTSTPVPTAAPVATASAISLDKAQVSVAVSEQAVIVANLTPVTSNEQVQFTSDKPEIASVAASGQTVGVITGVKEGTATITAKIGADSKTCLVTVTKFIEKATLTAATQRKANAILVTFESNTTAKTPKDIVNKADIEIKRTDGLGVTPVTTLSNWSADGKTCLATMASSFVDGKEYEVSYQGGTGYKFVASVGPVASIKIVTASAPRNVATVIEYELDDAKGIDVTSNNNPDVNVDIDVKSVAGNKGTVTSDTSKKSAPTVTMTNIGDIATVTIKYAPPGQTTTVAPAEGNITCVAPTAVEGTPIYKLTSNTKVWGDNTECAKFYDGAGDNGEKVAVGETKSDLYFCATTLDDAKKVVSYDSYKITSENEDVLSASVEAGADTGKYVRISITGRKVGNSNVIVEAIKNDVGFFYKIPVQVVGEKNLVSLTVTPSDADMSNAIESDYYGTLKVEGKYNDDSVADITADCSFEIANADKMKGYSQNLKKVLGSDDDCKKFGAYDFTVLGNSYWAWGAKANTYTIVAKASDKDGKEITGRTTVKVSDLPQNAWNTGDTEGVALTYAIKWTAGDKLDVAGTSASNARLAAFAGKQFAGYVRQNEDGSTIIGTGNDYVPGENGVHAFAAVYSGFEDQYLLISSKDGNTKKDQFNGWTFSNDGASSSGMTVIDFDFDGTPDENVVVTMNVEATTATYTVKENDSLADVIEGCVEALNAKSAIKTKYDIEADGDGITLTRLKPATTAVTATITTSQSPLTATINEAVVDDSVEGKYAEYEYIVKGKIKKGSKLDIENVIEAGSGSKTNFDYTATLEDESRELIAQAWADAYNANTDGTNTYTATADGARILLVSNDMTTIANDPEEKDTRNTDVVVKITGGVTPGDASTWTYEAAFSGTSVEGDTVTIDGAGEFNGEYTIPAGKTAAQVVTQLKSGRTGDTWRVGAATTKFSLSNPTPGVKPATDPVITFESGFAGLTVKATLTNDAAKSDAKFTSAAAKTLNFVYPETCTSAADVASWWNNYDGTDKAAGYASDFTVTPASWYELEYLAADEEYEIVVPSGGATGKGSIIGMTSLNSEGATTSTKEKLGTGSVKAKKGSVISKVYGAVKFGNKYSKTGELYASTVTFGEDKGAFDKANPAAIIKVSARNYDWTGDVDMVVGKPDYDWSLAKSGTYTAYFFWTKDDANGTEGQAQANVVVANGFRTPVVSVDKRTIDSLDSDAVKDALSIDVDMNNNTSDAQSFNGHVWSADKDAIITPSFDDGSKWKADYVSVVDQGIVIAAPVNATFTLG